VLAFLNESKEHPDDDTPRLVLADWLEERGDERGEFVRLQCLRAARGGQEVGSAEGAGREAELLASHREAWLGILCEKGIRTESWRGLVRASGSPRKLLSKRLASLGAYEPVAWVDGLCLYDFRVEDLARLAASPHWTSLTRLDLGKSVYYADQLADPATIGKGSGDGAPLAALAVLPRLTELDLRCQDLGAAGATALAALPDLKRLRCLRLSGNNLGDSGAAVFASSRCLTGLAWLDLTQNRLRADGFASLARWPGLATVTSLFLGSNYPGPEGVKALSASPWLGNLTKLRLEAEEHSLPASFGPASFGPAGAAALAEARGLTRLMHLHLSGNRIGPEGAEALAASGAFPGLIELDLSENQIGDAGAVALANCPALRGLWSLDLRCNRIGDRGARALANSPYLPKMTVLNFRANWDTSPSALASLRERFGEGADVGETISPSPR
jgi:uncharacterized protein (TIGR02996 family)